MTSSQAAAQRRGMPRSPPAIRSAAEDAVNCQALTRGGAIAASLQGQRHPHVTIARELFYRRRVNDSNARHLRCDPNVVVRPGPE